MRLLDLLVNRLPKPMFFGVMGGTGCVAGDIVAELLLRGFDEPPTSGLAMATAGTGAWTALLAIGLVLALTVGQNCYLRRQLLRRKEWQRAAIGGAFAGGLAGALAQIFYSICQIGSDGKPGFFVNVVARVPAWGIFGALMGVGMSWIVPNLPRSRAAMGGAVGGATGAIGFLLATFVIATAVAGRIVGAFLVGMFIGLMVAIVEQAFRKFWLELRYGPGEVRTVNLGSNRVTIGCDRTCTVFMPSVSPNRAYFIENGQVKMQVGNGKIDVLSAGDAQPLGKVTVTVRVGATEDAARFRLQIQNGGTIELREGQPVRGESLPGLPPKLRSQIVAELSHHPTAPNVVGLKNLMPTSWTATLVDGSTRRIEPGESIKLTKGVGIEFGGAFARVT